MRNKITKRASILLVLTVGMALFSYQVGAQQASVQNSPSSHPPHINGPSVFGVRPKSPFLYTIPVTGNRPMQFGVEHLPNGLAINPVTGQITGLLKSKGEYLVVLRVTNAVGTAQKNFRIVVGDKIALTPPLGWNSWNCWGDAVDQGKVLRSARAMVSSGLINHGWTYINIDDTWQGHRGGPFNAIQPNEKFSDLKALCDAIHGLGLKAGIYSTPWIASYGKNVGGSSDDSKGTWTPALATKKCFGKYSFAKADVEQWAAWGFDYLKYDWFPIDVPHVKEMSRALRKSGRDIIFSLSNTAPLEHASDWAELANCWRVSNDIRDGWDHTAQSSWQYSVSEIGFSLDRWAAFAGPGHWNDPDMLVVGQLGWGPKLHVTNLTPDEQRSHLSIWCLLSAPLLLGCDLEQLDSFTLSLLTNDEVLALDQDALGQQAIRVATLGSVDVYSKALEDGGVALGFFNRDSTAQTISFAKLSYLGFKNRLKVRDLWEQQDLPEIKIGKNDKLAMTIPAHGVRLYKLYQ